MCASWSPRSPGEEGPRSPRPSLSGTDDGAPNAAPQAADAPPSSPSDRTASCPGCKTHQRPGFLCPECGRFVRFPVDKYPGQTNHIPF